MRKIAKAVLLSFLALLVSLSASAVLSGEDTKWMRTPDVVYVGTPYDVVSKMLRMAKVKKGDRVYDLGCGDARMLILAAQKYGCRGKGYDIDPERVRASRENVARNNVGDLVKIFQADIFTIDLSKADVIPIYLLPEMNRSSCRNWISSSRAPESSVTTTTSRASSRTKPLSMVSNEDNASHTLSLYTTPLRRKE